MNTVFLSFLNRAVAAGWLVLAVLVLRLLLRRAPKRLTCALWALVAVRLVLPFSIPSPLSLVPSAQTVVPESIYAARPVIETGIPAVNSTIENQLQSVYYEGVTVPAGTAAHAADLLAVLWIAGGAVLMLYCLGTWLHLRFRLRTAVRLRDDLWQSEWVDSPFVLGLFRPRIYLPFRLSADDLAAVEAHERAHIARGDHVWKVLAFLLLALYWFHPLLWVSYFLFCRDLEYACDQRVIRSLDEPGRQRYSAALLRCAAPRRAPAPCPVAFGEAGVSGRIKTVLNYRRPAFWLVLLAALALIVTAVCFLTDPPAKTGRQWLRSATASRLEGAEICLNYDGSGQCPYYNYTGFTYDRRKALASLLRKVDASRVEEGGHRMLPPQGDSLFFPRHGVYLSTPAGAQDDLVELQYGDQLSLLHHRELADFLRTVLPGSAVTCFAPPPSGGSIEDSPFLPLALHFACDTVDISYGSGLLDRGTPPLTNLNPDGSSTRQSGKATALGTGSITWKPPVLDEGQSSLRSSFHLTLSGGESGGGALDIDVYGGPAEVRGEQQFAYRFTVLNNTLPVTLIQDNGVLHLWDAACRPGEEGVKSTDDVRIFNDHDGVVSYDVDGDGVTEACSLGTGPTSGVFTFTVAAWKDGAMKYHGVFMPGHWSRNENGDVYVPDHGQISFVLGESGLQVCFTEDVYPSPLGGEGAKHLYDVSVRDGHLVLTGEDGELRAWG